MRVCKPGGRVLATEFFWRKPPTAEARQLFLGEVCPGLQFDSMEDWVRLYSAAGLADVQVETGPFDMMTPAGFTPFLRADFSRLWKVRPTAIAGQSIYLFHLPEVLGAGSPRATPSPESAAQLRPLGLGG